MKRKSEALDFDHSRSRRFTTQRSESCDQDNGDINRINQLPDHLLSLILSNLSLRDIHKTSLVSRCWKDLWSPMSNLTLDWPNFDSREENRYSRALGIDPCVKYKHKFVQGVNHITECCSQDGKISSFKISFCLGHEDTFDIDRWLRFSLGKGTEKLHLELICPNHGRRTFYQKSELTQNKYIFCSEALHGMETNLKLLELSGCVIQPKLGSHFHCLETLCLREMWLESYDLGSVLTDLLNLKVLNLGYSFLQKKLCLGSLTLLQTLIVILCHGISEIQLSNVNLITFVCKSYENIKCNYSGAPNLKYVCCRLNEVDVQYMFTHLQVVLPELKMLNIYCGTRSITCVPTEISIFKSVSRLGLYFWDNRMFDVSKLMHIISFFPQLHRLQVETLDIKDSEDDTACWYVFPQLKVVDIHRFSCSLGHIKFVAHLLRSAPNLEKLNVLRGSYNWYFSIARDTWMDGEKKKFYEILQQLLVDDDDIELIFPIKYYLGRLL